MHVSKQNLISKLEGSVSHSQNLRLLPFLLLFLLVGFAPTIPGQKRVNSKNQAGKAAVQTAKAPSTIGLTYGRFSSSYHLNSDGTAVQTLEFEKKCENADCLKLIGTYAVEFNSDLQRVKVLDAYVVALNGTRATLPSSATRDRKSPQAEAAPGFTSIRVLEIAFGDVEVGDTVGAKIEMRTIKPIFGNHFGTIEAFPSFFAWKSVEIAVSTPAAHPIYVDVVGLTGGRVGEDNGRVSWRWTAKDLDAIPVEPLMADVLGSGPRLVLTTFKDFTELGAAFGAGVKENALVTGEVKKLADDITAGISDPKEQASAIYTWVNKNIRYLQVYVDRDGWIPHSTTEILANRYGDCKDYTTLIYALLKAKGIESIPTLIRVDASDWFPTVASTHFFNHAVLYIPGLDVIADATAPNTRLGMIHDGLTGKKALLAGDQPRIIDVRKNDPDGNRNLSEVEARLQENGGLRATSRNKYEGRMEMIARQIFDTSIVKDPDFLKIIFALQGLDGGGRITKISDPTKVHEPFSVEFDVTIPNYTSIDRKGKLSIPAGVNTLNFVGLLTPFLTAETRKTNLVLGAQRFSEKYRVILPQTMTIDSLPGPFAFENRTGRFSLEFKPIDGGVEITREFVLQLDVITPADYPLFRDLHQKIVAAQKEGIGYTSTATAETAKKSDRKDRKTASDRTSPEALVEKVLSVFTEKSLSAAEARRLERLLVTSPDDFEARRKLVRHYSDFTVKDTAARQKARLTHMLWFVRRHPEIPFHSSHLWLEADPDSPEYQVLRDEWLKQVAAHKDDAVIRLNAAGFIGTVEPQLAMQIVTEGRTLHPDNYKFGFAISELLKKEFDRSAAGSSARKELGFKYLDEGEKALIQIKSDRSSERDDDREELLKGLSMAAAEIGEIGKARVFARELILDFGPSPVSPGSASAVHIGNITLGLAELEAGNLEKAKEYLIVAIRAPLRLKSDDIDKIDTRLSERLFAKGEKAAVAEYLRLSLDRKRYETYPDLYKEEIDAIKHWIALIEQGISPTFDFREPRIEPSVPARKKARD